MRKSIGEFERRPSATRKSVKVEIEESDLEKRLKESTDQVKRLKEEVGYAVIVQKRTQEKMQKMMAATLRLGSTARNSLRMIKNLLVSLASKEQFNFKSQEKIFDVVRDPSVVDLLGEAGATFAKNWIDFGEFQAQYDLILQKIGSPVQKRLVASFIEIPASAAKPKEEDLSDVMESFCSAVDRASLASLRNLSATLVQEFLEKVEWLKTNTIFGKKDEIKITRRTSGLRDFKLPSGTKLKLPDDLKAPSSYLEDRTPDQVSPARRFSPKFESQITLIKSSQNMKVPLSPKNHPSMISKRFPKSKGGSHMPKESLEFDEDFDFLEDEEIRSRPTRLYDDTKSARLNTSMSKLETSMMKNQKAKILQDLPPVKASDFFSKPRR